ncbi:MAG: DUF2062 domain-containing protein [Alphaproteobacteria bacterium]
MFQRRNKLNYFQQARELVWPSMGWRRALSFTRHRVLRLSASTQSIASGLALGTSISFSPLLGTHFLQVALLGWFMRANILCGLIATFLCNPWTIPFIWWASIEFGAFLFNLFDLPVSNTVPAHMDFGVFWHIVTYEPMRIFLPWMLGAYTIALLSYPFTYAMYYVLIDNAKKARAIARMHKLHQNAREVTEGTGQ